MPRPPSMFTVAPGAVIAGRYRLGGVLGRGGMAEVYEGHDLRLERPVAVKLLRPEMAARDDVRTRFRVEAQAAAGLLHPNAVAVYDTGEHDGVPFLVMERLPGETLADRIAGGPVDPAWLRSSAVTLLDALAVAHDAGIVHRDVKPGNILLAADGTAKLGDFGIAKSSGGTEADLTGEGQLLGTPAYLAPERIDGAPATRRSDLWALGVVLYEALAGRKPFVGGGPVGVARAVAAGDHVPLGDLRPDLPSDLVATVERAMARDPADRFADAREMAAALRGGDLDATVPVASDATLVLTEPAPAPAPPVPPQRTTGQRWLAWALVAALILLVVGVLARAGDRTPEATGGPAAPSTTVAAPTTVAEAPAPTLAERLREAARRLDPARDGPRAGDLASGLRQVAENLDAGSTVAAAGNATALAAAALAWNQVGQLADATLAGVLDLLGRVPGVQITTGGQAPPPASSAGIARESDRSSDSGSSGDSGSSEKESKGKGKGRGGDD